MFTWNQLILEIELKKDKFSPKKYPLRELSQDFSHNKKSGQTNPILQGNLHQKTSSREQHPWAQWLSALALPGI